VDRLRDVGRAERGEKVVERHGPSSMPRMQLRENVTRAAMLLSLAKRLADRAQRVAARSALLVRVAVAVRNQARCVIKYHLAESPEVRGTGEVWLQLALAPDTQRAVDVGANVGDWLAGLAAAKGQAPFAALAFEPSASARARLTRRFSEYQRITISDAAVGDRVGGAPFLEERDAGKGSTLVPGFVRPEGAMTTVPMTTLECALREAGWNGADLVKIDAEGYDAKVLRGAGGLLEQQRLGVVQFEYNRGWQLAGETLFGAYHLLERAGYQVFLLKREGLFTLNYERYEEYFEYSNFVAVSPAWMPRVQAYLRGTI
jgi:FkbM family methyltransferase